MVSMNGVVPRCSESASMSRVAVLSCSSLVTLCGSFCVGESEDGVVESALDLLELRGHGVNPGICKAWAETFCFDILAAT